MTLILFAGGRNGYFLRKKLSEITAQRRPSLDRSGAQYLRVNVSITHRSILLIVVFVLTKFENYVPEFDEEDDGSGASSVGGCS